MELAGGGVPLQLRSEDSPLHAWRSVLRRLSRLRLRGRMVRGIRVSDQPSRISKSSVISAVLPSMIEAEQYFSCDSLIACSTRLRLRPFPRTTKCMWILVNTLGSVSALSELSFTSHPLTFCPLFLRITTTS